MAVCNSAAPNFSILEPPTESYSPPRSPRRKAQFAIKELDPLLGNLSPDSTLKALQATETISGDTPEDAVASSIVDATPEEREMGIRSAFAAQKLREWTHEVSQWPWPSVQDRSFGLGFISPPGARSGKETYRGSLPAIVADKYETRLEEIRKDLDSLGIDEIKEHVLEAHRPATTTAKAPKAPTSRSSYGRMRDFTALVTATVIQALPDLAKLNGLLDTWDIRLRVLHDLPNFQEAMKSIQSSVQKALKEIKSPAASTNLTEAPFNSRKIELGNQVSDLGRHVDRYLDMLEGHDDSLPQAWIDTLEKIELDYATWVVEAQHIVLRNQLASTTGQRRPIRETDRGSAAPVQEREANWHQGNGQPEATSQPSEQLLGSPAPAVVVPEEDPKLPISGNDEPNQRGKSPAQLDIPEPKDPKGHKREESKVSIADSMFSTLSDLSNAEIVEVKRESVIPRSRASVVDNPLWMSRDEVAWFGTASTAQQQMASKPPMLQRASTASIEVFPREQVKRLTLSRSSSFDMLSKFSEAPGSSEGALTNTLRLLTRTESLDENAVHDFGRRQDRSASGDTLPSWPETPEPLDGIPTTAPGHPSNNDNNLLAADTEDLFLPPALMSTEGNLSDDSPRPAGSFSNEVMSSSPTPALPRRSSKRNTVSGLGSLVPRASGSRDDVEKSRDVSENGLGELASPHPPRTAESLDDRIQDILTTLPTKIRLTKNMDSSSPPPAASTSSTRASTPTPALTLSPAQAESSSRKSSLGGSEIKVYHLTRTGQSRDVPPVKLFVRTVGDGDRVMVRVGGGWADLGEYLREYSLHHGSRATADGRLEVASFPGKGPKDLIASSSGGGSQSRRKSSSPSIAQTGFESRASRNLSQSPESDKGIIVEEESWTPPPVPPLPPSYTTRSPTMTTSTIPGAGTVTTVEDPEGRRLSQAQVLLAANEQETPSKSRFSTISSPGVTTTTVVTPSATTTSYTPLGAAGPKMNIRRAATQPPISGADNEDWVKGMVGKARAVSGGSITTVQGPTTTTTTITTTASTSPRSQRTSATSPRAKSSPLRTSSSPASSTASDLSVERSGSSSRPKSRMSLSDIGGIKRVFLRGKSAKSNKAKNGA